MSPDSASRDRISTPYDGRISSDHLIPPMTAVERRHERRAVQQPNHRVPNILDDIARQKFVFTIRRYEHRSLGKIEVTWEFMEALHTLIDDVERLNDNIFAMVIDRRLTTYRDLNDIDFDAGVVRVELFEIPIFFKRDIINQQWGHPNIMVLI